MASERLLLKDFVFISTISDLGTDMLKLDVTPGEYGIKPLYEGYVWTTDNYTPDCKDIVKIFNLRDGDRGLSGTYHCGETDDPNHMRLFNKWLFFHLHDDYIEGLASRISFDELYEISDSDNYLYLSDDTFDGDSSDDYGVKRCKYALKKKFALGYGLKSLPDYHNLPVIFYLNRSLTLVDLNLVFLKASSIKKFGNVKVWRVEHEQYGDIGVAVQQKRLHDMMGDQAGIAFFATTSAHAFGYFKNWHIKDEDFASQWVCYPNYKYICKFNPCCCDTSHKHK